MSVPGILRRAAKAVDNLTEAASPVKKALDNMPQGMPVEHIDLGDTPLPGVSEAVERVSKTIMHPDDMVEVLIAEKSGKVADPVANISKVLSKPVAAPVNEASHLEVEMALSDLDGKPLNVTMSDLFDHKDLKYPELSDAYIAKLGDQFFSGEFTPEVLIQKMEQMANDPDAEAKILDMILEDLNKSGASDLVGDPEVNKGLAKKVYDGDMDLEDAKASLDDMVIKMYKLGPEDTPEFTSAQVHEMLPNYGVDMTKDQFETQLGTEWGLKLMKMVDGGVISEDTLHDFITANKLKLTAEQLPPNLNLTWEKITDMFEFDVDQLVAMHQKGQPTFASDGQMLTMHFPDSPLSLQEQVDLVGHLPSYKHIKEWTDLLPHDEQKALSAMTFIRGQGFLKVAENIRANKYDAGAGDFIEKRPYTWPTETAVKNLDDMDIAALNFYTQRGDRVMNEALRMDAKLEGTDLGYALDSTIRALDSLPSWDLEDSEYLFRHISDPAVGRLYEALEPGQEYTEKAFMSSTYKQLVSPITLQPVEQHSLGAVTMVIKPKVGGNGKAIEYLSEFEHEREVLFKPKSRFRLKRVVDVTPVDEPWGKKLVVFVDEI